MYLDHFGLVADPFALSPDPRLLYSSQSHEETMAHLAYGLEQGEEIILLTGDIGMGKTLALQCLTDRISSKFRCITVSSTKMGFKDLLKLILMDLSVSTPTNADLADLHIAFKKVLKSEMIQGRHLLLIIDEAQNLNPNSLESFRLLLSLFPARENNLNIVLAGQPGLNHLINLPELAQLRQRIRVHYHMEPLTRKEIKNYINLRTSECGQANLLFRDNAIDVIFNRSKGVPRLVNHLANQALLAAYVAGTRDVSRKHLADAVIPSATIEDHPVFSPEPARPVADDDRTGASTASPSREAAPEAPVQFEEKSNPGKILIPVLLIAGIVCAYFFWTPFNTFVNSQVTKASSPNPPVELVKAESPSKNPKVVKKSSEALVTEEPVSGKPKTSNPVEEASPPETEVVAPAETPALVTDKIIEQPKKAAPSVSQLFAVHVASFQSEDRAQLYSRRISEEDYPTFIKSIAVGENTWYRVYVGEFTSKSVAFDTKQTLDESKMVDYSSIIEL